MASIDITTTQNVTIKYDLASLRDRFFAFFIDQVIIFGGGLIIFLLLLAVSGGEFGEYIWWVVVLPIFFFYTLVSEYFMHGQTWGKKALGIKAVKVTGKQPLMQDFMIRWVFRMVDIWFSIGAVGSIMVNSSANGQRLGDMLANTAVIRVKPNLSLELADILNINSLQDYVPQYPEVRHLSEQDMLLVKSVMERSRKFNNQAHRDAVTELTNRLRELLDIAEKPVDQIGFLRTLIKDYIVLTR